MARKKLTKEEFYFLLKNKKNFKSVVKFLEAVKVAGFNISYSTCYRILNNIDKWGKINKIAEYSDIEKAWNIYVNSKYNKKIKEKIKKRNRKKYEDFLKILAYYIKSNKNLNEAGILMKKNIPASFQQEFVNIVKKYNYLIFPKKDKIEISENIITRKNLRLLNFIYQNFDIEVKDIKEILKKLI